MRFGTALDGTGLDTAGTVPNFMAGYGTEHDVHEQLTLLRRSPVQHLTDCCHGLQCSRETDLPGYPDHGLLFADSLSEQNILDALNEHGIKYRDRVFTPVTTIWRFLSRVLNDDHNCSNAVSRIIAHRAASGLGTCSRVTTPDDVRTAPKNPVDKV